MKISNGDHTERLRSDVTPIQRPRIQGSHPAFANLVHTVSSAGQAQKQHRMGGIPELFPDKVVNTKRSEFDSSLVPEPTALSLAAVSLFEQMPVEQAGLGNSTRNNIELFPDKVPTSQAARNSGKSLAERIQDGTAAEATEAVLDLSQRVGGRRRRRKAEDHF